MKTVAKIDPEKEYVNAKKMIDLASRQKLDKDSSSSLDSSVDNLITAARVLIEREERRRGKKRPPKELKKKGRKKGENRQKVVKIPSEKFPNLEVEERTVVPEIHPNCPCCNEKMRPSGLYDTTEKLETIPKRYYIERIKRPKFNCSHCYGSMVNTSPVPSIVPSSNYGDSIIIDVALSKYCDLIPIERYVQIARRNGVDGIPPQSLIGLTHHLADFFSPIYQKIKKEVLSSPILQADETPHKMLEGDNTKNWYLWGFFSWSACYFETHNTRSGDIVFHILKDSLAEYLVTDGYAGYKKAIRKIREDSSREIVEVNCNAHAYRYFKDASITWVEESKVFEVIYGKIYDLERERKERSDKLSFEEQLDYRQQMIPLFDEIKKECEEQKDKAMPNSLLMKAMNYFLNHYEKLIVCTKNINIPLDNNLCEREIRSPVIGRKTWFGTHSKRGAETASILFSIVQSCKLNNINPRNYFSLMTDYIHSGKEIITPNEYLSLSPSG